MLARQSGGGVALRSAFAALRRNTKPQISSPIANLISTNTSNSFEFRRHLANETEKQRSTTISRPNATPLPSRHYSNSHFSRVSTIGASSTQIFALGPRFALDGNANSSTQFQRLIQKRNYATAPPNVPIHKIRNVGIIAHIDAGKTTTTERMLYYSGVTKAIGDVDDGDTVTDYMEQERQRGITIQSAAITFPWRDHKINLIDTPGHVDFTVEVERSVRVLDGAVAIFDGVSGVEAQSRTVWKQADRYNVPRIAYINKMDKMGANLRRAVDSMIEKLNCNPLVIQYPLGVGEHFRAVVDLLTMEVLTWPDDKGEDMERTPLEVRENGGKEDHVVKPEVYEEIKAARNTLIEQLAEFDEPIADLFLEDPDKVTADMIKASLRRATLEQRGVVVMCGASFKNKGVQPVMDGIVDYLPSPLEIAKPKAIDQKTGKVVEVTPDPKGPLCALAFKVIHDPHRGPLVFLRVYSGTLSTRSTLFNATKKDKERPSRLLQIFANMTEDIPEIQAGNIGAAVGLKLTATGDTMISPEAQHKARDPVYVLEGVKIPKPVFFCSVEPESSTQEKALEQALAALQKEDPSFQVTTDKETGQTLMCGMGELHLEIIKDRLLKEYNLDVSVGKVQISYRETVSKPVTKTHTFERQLGNKHHLATLTLRVEPASERGAGNQFNVKLDPNLCQPSEDALRPLIPFIKQGVEDGMSRGPLVGFPLEDVIVTLVGGDLMGSSATGENTQVAFRACAAEAVGIAAQESGARLLEPIMLVQIALPSDSPHVGEVISSLTGSRRAKIRSVESKFQGDDHTITAEVPLSEMVGYSSVLRSITHGSSHYFMEFLRCNDLSPAQQEKILKELRGF